jgi:DNA-binding HxlR family transcriptional regulator
VSLVAGNGTSTTATSPSSGALASLGIFGSAAFSGESLLREVQATTLLLAPVCWIILAGMWVWRGRVRARYSEMGFGSDVFELFMKMKGGATRIKVLNKLATPKDRLQLAEELGVDWKTVDRHVQILHKYGFVTEQAAYGTVRLYQVTPMGKMLLNLFDDLERTDGPASQRSQPAPLRSQEERPSGS